MPDIDGGTLSFKSIMDNEQLYATVDETYRRVTGLSDATVAQSKKMDGAFDGLAEKIKEALMQIGDACQKHENELSVLEDKYNSLGVKADEAFTSGRDDEYRAIEDERNAIKGEISIRQHLLNELRQQSDVLQDNAQKLEENKAKTEENGDSQVSMRTKIRNLREEMMALADQGIDQQSEAYQRLKNELGRLVDIQGDVVQQGKVLANDEQKFQGVITGLSGLAGAFSTVTGTVSLFAGENENLQKVMTKVQSVMAITMGMQQVAQTLNKDSAFRLVTVNNLKKWWADIVAKSTVAETAETIATNANTVAQNAQATVTAKNAATQATNTIATDAQTTAATAGTVANLGLAGAIRLVGNAIKSIPAIGWIIAGISAFVELVSKVTQKTREAKKAQEELSKAIVEGCYKPIGSIEELSQKYASLGDDMNAKKQFIEDNKKSFDDLGVSVRDVADAQNLLITNKEAFIQAQIDKAKSLAYSQQISEKVKKVVKMQVEYESMPDTVNQVVQSTSGTYGMSSTYVQGKNLAKEKKKAEIDAMTKEIADGYKSLIDQDKRSSEELKKAGIRNVGDYEQGTIGAIEKAISDKQEAMKNLVPNSDEWKKENAAIISLQKRLGNAGGNSTSVGSANDNSFEKKLDYYKSEYDRFSKWVNSSDSIIAKAAKTEFSALLNEGATYIDYLKNQRDIILSVDVSKRTSEQNAELRTVNDRIAEETKKTVLDAFNEELSNSLTNAKTTIEMLNIIAQKRKELANDGTDVDESKKAALDDAEKNTLEKQKEDTDNLLTNYASYLDRKMQLELQYYDDIELLNKRLDSTTDASEKTRIQRSIDARKKAYDNDSKKMKDEESNYVIESSNAYIALFTSASNMSRRKLKETLDTARQVAKVIEGEDVKLPSGISNEVIDKLKESPQELQALYSKILELKEEYEKDDQYPFASFINGFKDLKESAKYAKKALKETDDEQSELYERQSEVLKKNGLSLLSQDAVTATDAFGKLVDVMKELAKVTSDDKLAESAEKLGALSQNLSAAAKGFASSGSWVGAVIGGVSDMISQTVDAFMTKKTEMAKFENDRLDFLQKYELTLLELSDEFDKSWGDRGFAKVQDAAKKAEDAITKYYEYVNKKATVTAKKNAGFGWGQLVFGGFTAESLINASLSNGKASDYLNQLDAVKKGYTELQAMQVKTTNYSGWANFWGKKDKYTTLKELAPKLFDKTTGDFNVDAAKQFLETNTQISEEQKKQIQNAIDLKGAYDDAMSAIESEIDDTFGYLGDDFTSALVDAIKNSSDAWQSFHDSGVKAIESLGNKLAYELFIATQMDAFKEQLKKIYSDTGMSAEEKASASIDAMSHFFDIAKDGINNAEDFMSRFKEMAKEKGFDIWKSDNEDSSSLTTSINGVSEDTASMIGGQANAIRIKQAEIGETLRQQLSILAAIQQNTSYNRHLLDIRNDIRDIRNTQASDSLRSQGLS